MLVTFNYIKSVSQARGRPKVVYTGENFYRKEVEYHE